MPSKLPIDSIKAEKVLLRIYNKTKTLFVGPDPTSLFKTSVYLLKSVFSKEKNPIWITELMMK